MAETESIQTTEITLSEEKNDNSNINQIENTNKDSEVQDNNQLDNFQTPKKKKKKKKKKKNTTTEEFSLSEKVENINLEEPKTEETNTEKKVEDMQKQNTENDNINS